LIHFSLMIILKICAKIVSLVLVEKCYW